MMNYALAVCFSATNDSNNGSTHVSTRALCDEARVQLRCQILLRLAREVLEGAITAGGERLQHWRNADLLCSNCLSAWCIRKAVDHVCLCALRIVTLIVLCIRPLVSIPAVTIGATISVQMPLEEGHCLNMHKFILKCTCHDVRIANTDCTHV